MSQKQADYIPYLRVAGKLKKIARNAFPIAFCVAAALYITTVYMSDVRLLAFVDGEAAGYVNSTTAFSNAYVRLDATVDAVTDGSYSTCFDITYDLVHTKKPASVTEADAASLLWSKIEDDFTEAYMLYVDDVQAAASTSGTSLKALIGDIESDILATAGDVFGGVKIANDLRIEKQICLKSMLKTADEIDEMLNPLSDSSLTEYAKADTPEETITTRISAPIFASPVLDTVNREDETESAETLKLEYNFVNTVTLNEVIYYDTEYVEDPYTFIGNERITQNGVNGAKTVTYEILYDTEGNIIGRNAVSEIIIFEAANKIITVGTAEIPDAVSTGSLIWPCAQPKGVSSYYGWRYLYGKPDFHLGIDIPDDLGSPIWASDGGEVIWAGYSYSYGNSVRIQHADGVMTVYAHLDTMSVAVGDKVYKGQNVGTMGRTGVATGNHLHFEVRINNQTTDPIKYLPEV